MTAALHLPSNYSVGQQQRFPHQENPTFFLPAVCSRGCSVATRCSWLQGNRAQTLSLDQLEGKDWKGKWVVLFPPPELPVQVLIKKEGAKVCRGTCCG